jgi:hypothetical protein
MWLDTVGGMWWWSPDHLAQPQNRKIYQMRKFLVVALTIASALTAPAFANGRPPEPFRAPAPAPIYRAPPPQQHFNGGRGQYHPGGGQQQHFGGGGGQQQHFNGGRAVPGTGGREGHPYSPSVRHTNEARERGAVSNPDADIANAPYGATAAADNGAGAISTAGDPATAAENAIQTCENGGGDGTCQVRSTFSGGYCGYLSVGTGSWGTGGSPEEAFDGCSSTADNCQTPIGRCTLHN